MAKRRESEEASSGADRFETACLVCIFWLQNRNAEAGASTRSLAGKAELRSSSVEAALILRSCLR